MLVPHVANAKAKYEDTLLGVKVTYRCLEGYEQPHKHTTIHILYQPNGRWSNIPPDCQSKSLIYLDR